MSTNGFEQLLETQRVATLKRNLYQKEKEVVVQAHETVVRCLDSCIEEQQAICEEMENQLAVYPVVPVKMRTDYLKRGFVVLKAGKSLVVESAGELPLEPQYYQVQYSGSEVLHRYLFNELHSVVVP
jgi:hypothetical protein